MQRFGAPLPPILSSILSSHKHTHLHSIAWKPVKRRKIYGNQQINKRQLEEQTNFQKKCWRN